MVNYLDGKIYKLYCNDNDMTYIGSTCLSLERRFYLHKKNKRGSSAKSIIERNDCNIKLIEKYPCLTKKELLERERYWIKNTDCINKNIPLRNPNEYYYDHKENILKKKKQYYLNNKQKFRDYYLKNRDRIIQYRRNYYDKHKRQS